MQYLSVPYLGHMPALLSIVPNIIVFVGVEVLDVMMMIMTATLTMAIITMVSSQSSSCFSSSS